MTNAERERIYQMAIQQARRERAAQQQAAFEMRWLLAGLRKAA